MLTVKREYILPLCAATFVLFALLFVPIGGLIVTSHGFAPKIEDTCCAADVLSAVLDFTRSSALQLSVLIAAGFSSVAPLSVLVLSAFRGAALGYSISCASRGTLVLARSTLLGFLPFDIRTDVTLAVLYAMSSLALIVAGYITVCRAEIAFSDERERATSVGLWLAFAAASGGVLVLDIIRGVAVYLCA